MFKALAKNKLVLIVLGMVAVASIAAALYVKSSQPKPTQPTPTPDQGSESQEEQASDQTTPQNTDSQGRPNSSVPPPSSNSSAGKRQIYPYITYVTDIGSEIELRGNVDERMTATCAVTFEKTGYAKIEKTAKTEVRTNYSTCQGFNIPESEFPAKGEWAVKLRIYSDDAEGTTDAQTFTIS